MTLALHVVAIAFFVLLGCLLVLGLMCAWDMWRWPDHDERLAEVDQELERRGL